MKDAYSELNVITPFKSDIPVLLLNTINSLAKQVHQPIFHIIVYADDSSLQAACRALSHCSLVECMLYKYTLIPSRHRGIYPAINHALDCLNPNSKYIVLGAGDLLKINVNIVKSCHGPINLLPYSLTSNASNDIVTRPRHLYSGMPYCHNAIVFTVNHLRYSQKYSISSDYLYLFQYLLCCGVSIQQLKAICIGTCFVTYESISGISSRKVFKKNFENILIVSSVSKLSLGIFFYIIFSAERLLFKYHKKWFHT